MKRQRGQAFILVLIMLSLGSLLIIPVLNYTYTGLRSQQTSEEAITNQYAADTAIEDALWMMLHGAMDNLTQSGSSVAYDFTYGTSKYPVVISVPSVPLSQQLATGSMKYLMLEVSPNFLTGSTANATQTTNYILRFQSQPWAASLSPTFEVTLPKGFTYTANSTWSRGPDPQAQLEATASANFTSHQVKNKSGTWIPMTNSPGFGSGGGYAEVTTDPPPGGYKANWSYLIKTTLPDGSQHLKYKVAPSNTGGNMVYIMTYQVTGQPPSGISYALFSYIAGSYSGTNIGTAALGVAFYRILMEVGGITYDVIVAYDSTTGGMTIISYLPIAG